MALTNGAATSDKVDIGTTRGLVSSTFTILGWFYVTTLTNVRCFYGSSNNGAAAIIQLRLSGTGGNIELRVVRATTTTSYITNDTPFATTSAWKFVAFTFDSSASPTGHIYTGNLTTVAVESTYGTSTAGSGAVTTETGGSNIWGNRTTTSTTSVDALQGRLAYGMIYNRVLTLGEIIAMQFRPRVLAGCVNYIQFGFNGTSTQPDWSGAGHNGTVTGATSTPDHVPIGPFFSGAAFQPYAVASATVTVDMWRPREQVPVRIPHEVVSY